jgi:hypothetical protein
VRYVFRIKKSGGEKMTSDQLCIKYKPLEGVYYLINAEGGVSLPFGCSLYNSIEDADHGAISHAMHLARSFTSVILSRQIGGGKKEILYNSSLARRLRTHKSNFYQSFGGTTYKSQFRN